MKKRSASSIIVTALVGLSSAIVAYADSAGNSTGGISVGPETPIPLWVPSQENVVLPSDTAVLSPDGLRAVWATSEQRTLLSATRATRNSPWAAPDRLLTTRGVIHKIAFSPDGKSIAYENQRTSISKHGKDSDTWQFISVYDFDTRKISSLDPSFGIDADPVWNADGSKITFHRRVDSNADAHLTKEIARPKSTAWAPPPQRPGEQFTMASVLAAPFISPPTPSGDGTSIAYITREGADRNLYFLRDGERARLLARYAGDDGQAMSPPAVSKNGAAVAYVRGGPVNRQGDIRNPSASHEPPRQHVWILGSQGSDKPRLLGSGSNVMFTPNDRSVIWRSQGNVMGADLIWENGRMVGVGNPYELLSGERRAMRFSPDGGKVVYQRGDGIEVYDFATKTATAIPHGPDVDLGPVWSPDGTQIAFRREPIDSRDLPRNWCGWHNSYCGPMTNPQPWAIWTVNTSDLQQPRKVWQANAGVGSTFYALNQAYSPATRGDQLFWSANGSIVFPWEGDGWRHLYSVAATGGPAKLLTPGDGEVETAALARDGRSVIYATNIGDLGRRHISEVRLDGKQAKLEIKGEMNQWSPTPMANGKLAYIQAGWADTPTVVLRDSSGGSKIADLPRKPSGFPSDRLVKPELVQFPASDGKAAYGQLFVPPHPNGCAIVYAHGGPSSQMLPGFHYASSYAYNYAMNQYLASRGCVVLSVEYRGSIMRGHDFHFAVDMGFTGNSELRDFVGAARFLKARKDVDARRGVGIYGLSWGGYITAQLLAQHSDLFSVGFDMAGVHESVDRDRPNTSPLAHVNTWNSPIFLAHSDDDDDVDFFHGIRLARALQVKRPQVELKQQVIPGESHDLSLRYEHLVRLYMDGSDWLLTHLNVK